ncbi:FAD-dependent oxidoreductase [Micromonospora sp. LOL_024]|uniref:FAD-dependent oxidoreductase n=1 Tax=Micromonospora sp. LOL_024 TaxID=3345412 RepID=UPI003A84192B
MHRKQASPPDKSCRSTAAWSSAEVEASARDGGGRMAGEHRVAVVGGGIFGVTAAVHLARAGHHVVLHEAGPELLQAASAVNQRRLHRGYHYPRSTETALAARDGAESFAAEYPQAVRADYDHYVAIARRDSLVSAGEYLDFCRLLGLEYIEDHPPYLRTESVDLSLRIREDAIDVDALRAACWLRLIEHGVDVRLRSRRRVADLAGYDQVVFATYARLNDLQAEVPGGAVDYQFEVCEKPVVRLPPPYHRRSLVILDGPFLCVDPLGPDGSFVLGNVVHAIHATTLGRNALVPAHLVNHLDRGITRSPASKFPAFVRHARDFLDDIDDARYLGSLFTIRAVLPGLDSSDARPTLVRRLDERSIAVFGGKIATCVAAARQVTAMLNTGVPYAVRR